MVKNWLLERWLVSLQKADEYFESHGKNSTEKRVWLRWVVVLDFSFNLFWFAFLISNRPFAALFGKTHCFKDTMMRIMFSMKHELNWLPRFRYNYKLISQLHVFWKMTNLFNFMKPRSPYENICWMQNSTWVWHEARQNKGFDKISSFQFQNSNKTERKDQGPMQIKTLQNIHIYSWNQKFLICLKPTPRRWLIQCNETK